MREKTVAPGDFDGCAEHNGCQAIWTSPHGRRYQNAYLEIGEWEYWRIEGVIDRDLLESSAVETIP